MSCQGIRHLKTLGHGRGGAQRNINDPHEIPRGALLIESGLFRGVISGVDVDGYHQAVEVSGQGWPGDLYRDGVASANGPLDGPQERAIVTCEPPGNDCGREVEGVMDGCASWVDAHREAYGARFVGAQGVAGLAVTDGREFLNVEGPGRQPVGSGG
jgi:hypothetical protein